MDWTKDRHSPTGYRLLDTSITIGINEYATFSGENWVAYHGSDIIGFASTKDKAKNIAVEYFRRNNIT